MSMIAHDQFSRRYIEVAMIDTYQRIAGTPAGRGLRNQTLNRETYSLARLIGPNLSESAVLENSLKAAEANGYVKDHGRVAALAIIKDAIRKGQASPRTAPPNEYERKKMQRLEASPPPARTADVIELHAHVTSIEEPAEPDAAPDLPTRTPPDEKGKPYFKAGAEPPKSSDDLRSHAYRVAGVTSDAVRCKIKRQSGGFVNWYKVRDPSGVIGWQSAKPEGYQPRPYIGALDPFDPENLGEPVCWPEGERDVDTISGKLGLVALAFGGTGDGLPDGCEKFLAGRHVTILADNDDAGLEHAERKAALIHGIAASVRVLHFPELPLKGDVTDWVASGKGADDLSARAAAAPIWTPPQEPSSAPTPQSSDGPIPLIPELATGLPYPIGALGSTLGEAAVAISRKIQAPVEIAAQSVLACASLAAQALANVRLPFGQAKPLSLCFVTIAASGERKTAVDHEASWPIRTREEVLHSEYGRSKLEHDADLASWEAEKKRIESERKIDQAARKLRLLDLGPAPLPPLHPFLTAPEPTIEGLIKAWVNAAPALGLFSAEGGQFVGGHGMSQDHRLKTAAALSEFWDGKGVRRVRAGDGVTELRGRRLAVHIMVQPDAATMFLSDATLRDQGLLSRVLVARPASIAGTRTFKQTTAGDEAAIKAYGGRLLRLLERRLPLAAGKRNELAPPEIVFSEGAEVLWREFYDATERDCGPAGRLTMVRDFAGKAAEHAARIAGVLAIVESPDAREIAPDTMRNAIELAGWYLEEALRLAAASMTSPAIAKADKLLSWLQANPQGEISLRHVTRMGPSDLRTKAIAESALAILVAHGWLIESRAGTRRRYQLVRPGQ